jgi:chemotaxis protein MotB
VSYRPPTSRAGQDRWLMSYADLVTLLFACFTTAYAASLTPAVSAEPATPAPTAVAAAVPAEAPAAGEMPEVTPTPAPAPAAEPSLRERLEPALAGGLDDVEIELLEDARGLVITLPETATFSSGSADLTVPAQSLLGRIAAALRPTEASIRIEGHTDDAAIRGGRYRSNWELSTARASAVVVFMVTAAGFEPSRLSAAGYGEFHPRSTNDDAVGRALNRRVDVVVIDSTAAAGSRAEEAVR